MCAEVVVLDGVRACVERIIAGCPEITVLATSQEPLRAKDEQQFRVVPLAVPPTSESGDAREFGAIALFEARVQAVDPKFSLNEYSPRIQPPS